MLTVHYLDFFRAQYEFVVQLSEDSLNTVFALVRNKSTATKLSALARPNVVVLQANITDSKALKVDLIVGSKAQN